METQKQTCEGFLCARTFYMHGLGCSSRAYLAPKIPLCLGLVRKIPGQHSVLQPCCNLFEWSNPTLLKEAKLSRSESRNKPRVSRLESEWWSLNCLLQVEGEHLHDTDAAESDAFGVLNFHHAKTLEPKCPDEFQCDKSLL